MKKRDRNNTSGRRQHEFLFDLLRGWIVRWPCRHPAQAHSASRPLNAGFERLEQRHLLAIDLISSAASNMAGNASSYYPSLSSDGRYVAFESYASDLVADDTNDVLDVFVKDTWTGAMTRVSTDSSGNEGNDDSSGASISADGRYIAFSSYARNLVPEEVTEYSDVFVKDMATGSVTLVSSNHLGQPGDDFSFGPSISPDGRYVAFETAATNLGNNSGFRDVFMKDTVTGWLMSVSTDIWDLPANGDSFSASVTLDGRYVAFTSYASNLVLNDTNGVADVFVKNTQQNYEVTRVSTDSSGSQANGHSYSYASSISPDGRFVVFASNANNLVPGDTNAVMDVFVKDLQTNETTRVSTDSSGGEGNGQSYDASISADGRYVAFRSVADNLVPDDTNGIADLFVKDTYTGAIVRVNTDSMGDQANGWTDAPSISADGRYVTFHSEVSNLHPGDTTTLSNVFRAALTQFASASIHGFQFQDMDGDGVYTPSTDQPLAGVEFILTGIDEQGNEIHLTSTTNSNGIFEFTDLLPACRARGPVRAIPSPRRCRPDPG